MQWEIAVSIANVGVGATQQQREGSLEVGLADGGMQRCHLLHLELVHVGIEVGEEEDALEEKNERSRNVSSIRMKEKNENGNIFNDAAFITELTDTS